MKFVQTIFNRSADALIHLGEKMKKVANPASGQLIRGMEVPGKGVFITTWQPEGSDKKFHVFAAKDDQGLRDSGATINTFTGQAFPAPAPLQNHGSDRTIYSDTYSYEGEWVIPPRETLTGTEAAAKNPDEKTTSGKDGAGVRPVRREPPKPRQS